MGGQEHFYLETNVTLAVPREEDGEMELFISSQSPSDSQVTIRNLCKVHDRGTAQEAVSHVQKLKPQITLTLFLSLNVHFHSE